MGIDNFYYEYDKLEEKAIGKNVTSEDVETLAKWFTNYGMAYWNGESWDVKDGIRLYPICEPEDPDDIDCDWKIVGYELR